jgi:hypothetical protein
MDTRAEVVSVISNLLAMRKKLPIISNMPGNAKEIADHQ